MAALTLSPHLATWAIAALATLGVIVRPFSWPEAIWAVTGALALVLLGLLPAGTARLWSDDVAAMLGIAVVAAMFANLVGLLVSYHFGLASGPAIILVAGLVYVASLVLAPLGLLRRWMPRRHLEA